MFAMSPLGENNRCESTLDRESTKGGESTGGRESTIGFRLASAAFATFVLLSVAPAAAAPAGDAASVGGATAAPIGSLEIQLADAIALAMRNNRRLLNGRLARAMQRFALVVAEDKFKPDFHVGPFKRFETEGGGWGRDDTGVTFGATLLLPTGGRLELVDAVAGGGIGDLGYDSALTLRFTQPLLKGGGVAVNMASLRMARATERIDALVFERAIGDVVTAVVVAYRALLQAQQRVAISALALQRAEDLLETNRALIKAGRMAEMEIVQAEADVARRELALVDAENRLDASRLALIDILDIDSATVIHPTEALSIEGVRAAGGDGEICAQESGVASDRHGESELASSYCDATARRNIALALENRPGYLQAVLRVENAEAELLLAKNNRLWDLSTVISTTVGGHADSLLEGFGDPFGYLPDDDLQVSLRLDVPIGDLAPKQRYLNAKASLEQMRANLAEWRQSIDIDVRNAMRDVDARRRQVDLAARASELAERKLEAEGQKLNLGLTTNFRIILFEDDLVVAQNGELDATIAYLNALATLDQTLGTTLQTWDLEVERVERLGGANAALRRNASEPRKQGANP